MREGVYFKDNGMPTERHYFDSKGVSACEKFWIGEGSWERSFRNVENIDNKRAIEANGIFCAACRKRAEAEEAKWSRE